MPKLTPEVASSLADDVYDVQSDIFAKAFLSRPEFSSKASDKKSLTAVVGSRLINTQDAFGLVSLGANQYSNDLFIIFRGSTTANHNADWVSNARLGVDFSHSGLPVHTGFNQIFTSMLPRIKECIAAVSDNVRIVHCVGHSLGGAVATLAASWIKREHPSWYVNLYTFGAPRPAYTLFASKLTDKLGAENIHRVYHQTDPVPMIPMYPFVHAPLPGLGHSVPSSQSIHSAAAHDIGLYHQNVKSCNWLDLSRSRPAYHFEHLIEGWLKSKIPVNPNSAKTYEWLNAAMIWVLKKILGTVAFSLQTAFWGVHTLADKIAWILERGVEISKDIGYWVYQLMIKIAQTLGVKLYEGVKALTRSLMQSLLVRLMDKMAREAKKAIRNNRIR